MEESSLQVHKDKTYITPFEIHEVQREINNIKPKKAPVHDSVNGEMLKE